MQCAYGKELQHKQQSYDDFILDAILVGAFQHLIFLTIMCTVVEC